MFTRSKSIVKFSTKFNGSSHFENRKGVKLYSFRAETLLIGGKPFYTVVNVAMVSSELGVNYKGGRTLDLNH